MIMHIPKSTYYHKWFIGATLVVPVLPLAAQTSPNLVFIMADQYRGDALGCLGKEPVKTPCLDHLASEGVLFTNAVSSYPVSSPARAMYNPQIEMFARFKNEKFISQNEAYNLKHSLFHLNWSILS